MTLRVRGGDIDRARSYKVMLRGLTATVLADPIMVAWVAAAGRSSRVHGVLFSTLDATTPRLRACPGGGGKASDAVEWFVIPVDVWHAASGW